MVVQTITLPRKHDPESSRCHNKLPNTLSPNTNSYSFLHALTTTQSITLGQLLHLRDRTLQTLLLPNPGAPGFLTFSILRKASGPNSDSHSRRGCEPRPTHYTGGVTALPTSAADPSADVTPEVALVAVSSGKRSPKGKTLGAEPGKSSPGLRDAPAQLRSGL